MRRSDRTDAADPGPEPLVDGPAGEGAKEQQDVVAGDRAGDGPLPSAAWPENASAEAGTAVLAVAWGTPDMEFLERLIPWFRRIRDYARLKVFGLEHVPSDGPALLVGNHTGWLGLDYVFTALSVYESTGRLVRGMVHDAWFSTRATAEFASKCGIIPISKEAMRDALAAGEIVMMFPEGERGAFRPGSDYTLEPFARGFVRLGMETHVPIIPVAILGGAESNPIGRRIESYEALLKLRGGLPIPKNLWPRPVKWRIRFLPPMVLDEYTAADASDHDLVHSIAEATRARLQREVRILRAERGHPYL